MEINNNNSPYHLHEEDKSDKNDKRMQCKNKISRVVFSREKIVERSLRELIEVKAMTCEMSSDKTVNVALLHDNDESSPSNNELVTQLSDNIPKIHIAILKNADNESVEKLINSEETIKFDSERLEAKCVGEINRVAITTSEVPLINEQNRQMTTSIGESKRLL